MSSINNTQRCLLKAAGVTYERLLPICLTLFSCSSCHAVRMSAATADGWLSCPPLPGPPLFPPHHHFRVAEKWLRHVRSPRYRGGCDTVTPDGNLPDRSVILSPVPTENPKQILSSISHWKKKKSSLSVRSFDNHLPTRPVISWTGPVWHSQWRGDGTRVVHLSSRLPLSPLLSISLVPLPCVHNLISKQGVDSHYGNPGKWPGHFPPPYLGSPSGKGTLALTAPLVQSQCVFWWAYAAKMAFTLHWLQWDWPTRLTLFESTTHFNNVTKQNGDVMLNKTFLKSALRRGGGVHTERSTFVNITTF